MTSGLRDVLESSGCVASGTPRRRARETCSISPGGSLGSARRRRAYMYANVNVLLLDELVAR